MPLPKLTNVASRVAVLKFQEELEKRRQQAAQPKPVPVPTPPRPTATPIPQPPPENAITRGYYNPPPGGGGLLGDLGRGYGRLSGAATSGAAKLTELAGRGAEKFQTDVVVPSAYRAQLLSAGALGTEPPPGTEGMSRRTAMKEALLPSTGASTEEIQRRWAQNPAGYRLLMETGFNPAMYFGVPRAVAAVPEALAYGVEFAGGSALKSAAQAGVRVAQPAAAAAKAEAERLYGPAREAVVGGEAGGLKLPFGKKAAEVPPVEPPKPEAAAMDFFEGAPKGEKVQRTLIRRHDGAKALELEQLDQKIVTMVKTARTGGVKLTGGRTEVTERVIGAADFQGPIEEGIAKYGLNPGEETLARAIRTEMEAEALRMKAVNPDFNPREFYFPHEWKPKPTASRLGGLGRTVGTKPFFTKPRALEGSALDIITERQAQVAAAAETGAQKLPRELDLVSWNPIEMVERRLYRGIIYRQEQILANEMKQQGIAVRVSELGGDLEGWVTPRGFKPFETARIPGTNEVDSWAVPEEIGKAVEDYFGSSAFSTYAPLKTLRNGIANAKFLKTFGGFFQHIDYAFRSMYHATKARDIRMLGTPFKAFARAYVPGVDAKMRAWERTSSEVGAVYRRLLIKHGLPTQAGMTFYGQEYRAMAKELWAFRIPGLGRYLKAFGQGTYSNAHREYLMDIGEKAVAKAVAAGVEPDAAAARVALDMGETFSSLPAWQSVFRNPTTRDFMRTGLFSMAENESWIRMPFRQKSFLVSAYISTAVMANMLSLAFNKELLSLDQYNPIRRKDGGTGFEYNTSFMRPRLPWPGPDGRELYLDLVGQADTFFRLVADPEFALKARAGQVPQLGGQLAMGEEWFSGKKLDSPKDITGFLARSLAPIPAAAGTQELGRIGRSASVIQAGGLNISAERLKDLRNRTAKGDPDFGKPFDDLGPQAKKDYKAKYPNHFAESEELTEGSPLQRVVEIGEERTQRLDALGKQLEAGEITGEEYIDGRADIITEAAIKSSEYALESDTDNPYDLAFGEWMDFIAAAKEANPAGVLTGAAFGELERQAKDQLGPEKWAMVEEKRMASADPVEKQYLQDRAKMETYWDVTDKEWRTFCLGAPETRALANLTYEQYKQQVIEDLKRQGMSEAFVDRDPIVKTFEKGSAKVREMFLVENPEVDALLIIWGYGKIAHSAEAATIYKERTGLEARPPAQ